MKASRHTRTIVLWLISIGLLIGMIITFTPSLGTLGAGGAQSAQGTVQLVVNGEQIREAQVQQMRQNPLFNAVSEGEVGADLQLLLVDSLIQNEVLAQAAAKNRVSNGAVAAAVKDFRKARGVDGRKNDQAYLNLIGSAGYTDQTFRDYLRQSLRERAFEDALTADVAVSDAEVRAWYDTHTANYQTEERILAREIVVDDAALAQDLLQQVIGGADFAALAREHSKELADRDGALGAAAGQTEPQPIGRPGLPTAVAAAAFALQGPGITDVIEANGRHYLVQIEAYLPPEARPFDEVKEQVAEDALDAKRSQVVQAELERLVEAANVSVPSGSQLSYDNPVVAKVGEETITAAELNRATYTNPQIQQALSPQTADLVTAYFKPAVLGQLIDTEVAYQGATELGLEVVGSKAVVAQAALDYVSRDATATERELQDYFEANKAGYTIPAEAVATRVDFASQDAAMAFRDAMLAGGSATEAAAEHGGTVEELGTVKPGDLVTALDTALFETDAFAPLPDDPKGVSDVLVLSEPVAEAEPAQVGDTVDTAEADAEPAADDAAADEAADAADEPAAEDADAAADDADPAAAEGDTTANLAGEDVDVPAATKDVYVVLLAARTPERVRSFDEVEGQVEASVLATKRQQMRSGWLDEVRATLTIENLLNQVGQPSDAVPADQAPGADAPAAQDDADAPADGPADAGAPDGAPADPAATPEPGAADEAPAANDTTN